MLTLLQTTPSATQSDSLSAVASWATILTAALVIGATVWVLWTIIYGAWLRKRGKWPVTLRITTVLGNWIEDETIDVYYTVSRIPWTWTPRRFPHVIRVKMIGEFSGEQLGYPDREEPYTQQLSDTEYPENEEISIERFRSLTYTHRVTGGQAYVQPNAIYLLVWVKYPPCRDITFRTESRRIVPLRVG